MYQAIIWIMTNSDIARTTLICSWLFASLATISITIQGLSIHQRRAHIGIDDCLLFTAYLVSVLLVAQTTWAVVDEGQGVHEADLSHSSQFGIIAKVCPDITPRIVARNWNTHIECIRKRNTLGRRELPPPSIRPSLHSKDIRRHWLDSAIYNDRHHTISCVRYCTLHNAATRMSTNISRMGSVFFLWWDTFIRGSRSYRSRAGHCHRDSACYYALEDKSTCS